MSEVAHQPPRTLRDVRTCLEKKSSFKSRAITGMPLWLGANDAPMYTPNTATCTPTNANAMPIGRNQNTGTQNAANRSTIRPSSVHRCSTFSRPSRCWKPRRCRFRPSSVSSGKNSQPWRRVMSACRPRALTASSSRKEIVSTSMSGSLPTLFGLAWWRLCLVFHQDRLTPTTPHARTRASRSLALPPASTCLCAASCVRNAVCVSRTPRPPAIRSWNHEWPSRKNPASAPANPAARTAPTPP